MLSQIRVGPVEIVIHQGDTFFVTAPNGEVDGRQGHGLFTRDTRLLSTYRLLVAGRPWMLATAAAVEYNRSVHVYLSPEIAERRHHVPPGDLQLRLERKIADALVETLEVTNFGQQHVELHLGLVMASDFADLFDVKQGNIVDRGDIDVTWDGRHRALTTRYCHQSFERGLHYRLTGDEAEPHYANGMVRLRLRLAPKQCWQVTGTLTPIVEGTPARPASKAHKYKDLPSRPAAQDADRLQKEWEDSTPRLGPKTSEAVKAYDQAVYDLGALRLFQHEGDRTLFLPAAGVPWFVAVFGRDSILTALESMLLGQRLARGTLHRLALAQARERDDAHDAQPGKIVHEMRNGELAQLAIVPHARYYGTADATILYLVLLSETWRWTGDEGLLREHRDTALRCLEWIDRYGDLDGDGLQEYKTFAPQGYHNQSWKDAGDAIVYPDGRQVEQPIATCELQGYVFDAKRRMAEILGVIGDSGGARQLEADARRLQQRVEQTFWMEEEGTYAIALDPDKQPVQSIGSNAGHLLWSGLVESEHRARRVIERLMRPDMYSGWGIRTLSSGNPVYNPHSYQRGSVWPHDNAIIAAGARRYGLWREANRICEGILAACFRFQNQRLPELFAGLERYPDEVPVQYLGANVPQAWASGSIVLMLQSMLGVEADAPDKRLRVAPRMPEWLGQLMLDDLRVGSARLSLLFSGTGTASNAEVMHLTGDLSVEIG